MTRKRLLALRALLLGAAAAAAIFANFALLNVARGDEPVGTLNPRVVSATVTTPPQPASVPASTLPATSSADDPTAGPPATGPTTGEQADADD